MYKTKNVTKTQLQAIQISNQDEIVRFIGKKFSPLATWEIIKNSSNNFKDDDPKLLEADGLLYTFINPQDQKTLDSDEDQYNYFKRKERERAIKILMLQAKVAA